MDSLLHLGGTALTLVFAAAVLYSLYSNIKKRDNAEKRDKALAHRKHVKTENLHSHDLKEQGGYIRYNADIKGYTHRFPQRFTAISLSLATRQPYSIYKLAFADFEDGELKDRHYFYVQPPENNLSEVTDPDVSWPVLAKADKFGEYWNAGINKLFVDTVLVAHNAPFVIGCILHALDVYKIDAPRLQFIDTLETAKSLYDFNSNSLPAICNEAKLDFEENNELSEAIAAGQFLLLSHRDYPTALPRIYSVGQGPTAEDIMAAAIAVIEREEGTPEEMFEPAPVDEALLAAMLSKGYITHGRQEGTYYATDKGLGFSEGLYG